MEGEACEMALKVILLGDAAVGKTSLVRRFVLDEFSDKYISTIGTKVSKKMLLLKGPDGRKCKVILMVWDILGQRSFRTLHETQMSGARGALFVCDLTRRDTLDSMSGWIEDFRKVSGERPLILLANKNDLKDRHTYGVAEVEEKAKEYDASYHLTSAKTGENVERAFSDLGMLLIPQELSKN